MDEGRRERERRGKREDERRTEGETVSPKEEGLAAGEKQERTNRAETGDRAVASSRELRSNVIYCPQ